MAFDRAALEELAESVGDGAPIQWDAIEAQAGNDQRAVIRQLRVLESLAHLHRTLPTQTFQPAPRSERSLSAPAIGNWGHLALLERLGGGTFGEVYRAWDRQLERDVALKVLRPDRPDASRLLAEARLLARIRHQHVVSVYGVDTHDERIGLWMELVRGVTLEQLLTTEGPFAARDAALVGIDLCRALGAIHAAGLVHRDVKAQNVMREEGGRLVLMDLGTGRDIGRGEAAAGLAGTPLYLAPEIFGGATASVQSDIYSLGVLLYHLVTGEYPVRAASFEALEQAHGTGAGAPLSVRRPDLPAPFVAAIDRALAREPEQRYKSAAEFESALVRALEAQASPPAWHRAIVWGLLGIAAIGAVLAAIALLQWRQSKITVGAASAPIRSIAVLPLRNDSGDAAQDYFADGMTDEIISTLGRLGSVNVISRTSSSQFKGMQLNGTTQTLPQIARALHADAVVEGSIALLPGSDGDGGKRKVRITARLIAAGTDSQIWNETFESVADDVIALESRVARAIAEGIRLRLSPKQQGALAAGQQRPPDFEAFNLTLQGRASWNVRTKASLERSIEYFQQAIARDPRYAAPHAGLADAYKLLGSYGWLPFAEAYAKAADEATKAIALDDTIAEPHVSLGLVHDARFEWDAAEASFQRAIQLNPGNVSAHHWYGLLLSKRGAFPQATAEVEKAMVLDPLSPVMPTQLAAFEFQQRNYSEAIARLERVVQAQPDFARAHFILAQAYAKAGRYDRALAEADRASALGGDGPEMRALVGCISAASGRTAEALAVVDELIVRYRDRREGGPMGMAVLYAVCNRPDSAFEWLDRAIQERDPNAAYLKVDPWFDSLRTDPRFDTLLARLGLTR